MKVGDYVKFKTLSREIKIVYFDIDKKDYIYSKVDIKSILTKEQFESMEYRIGE